MATTGTSWTPWPTRNWHLICPSVIRGLASQGGGRLLVPDLVHLDTGQVVRWEFRQDVAYYYLTLHYAGLPGCEVRRWRKW